MVTIVDRLLTDYNTDIHDINGQDLTSPMIGSREGFEDVIK